MLLMLADRYDLPLSPASTAARDAYAEGFDLALTVYPGAAEAFDRALAADPGFAIAHAGKAQILMREGKAAQARAALAAANGVAAGVSAREAGHIRFFDLADSGQSDAAIDVLHAHLAEWPRDALMVATAANPNGLIGSSGRVGNKRQNAQLLDRLAPHYGDDYWFLAYHATALSEDGQLAAARPKIERSVLLNQKNAHAAARRVHDELVRRGIDAKHLRVFEEIKPPRLKGFDVKVGAHVTTLNCRTVTETRPDRVDQRCDCSADFGAVSTTAGACK